jgi:hypothetical protein
MQSEKRHHPLMGKGKNPHSIPVILLRTAAYKITDPRRPCFQKKGGERVGDSVILEMAVGIHKAGSAGFFR